jgi:WD40 repeat protein
MMSTPGLMVRCLASTRVTGSSLKNGHSEELDHRDGPEKTQDVERHEVEEGDTIEVNEAVESSQHEDSYNLINDRAPESVTPSVSIHSDSESASSVTSSDNPPIVQSLGLISCIQEAQLSPDGTCIFTSDYDRAFSVYPIATDVLDSTATRPLKVYAQFKSADPIWAFAANPLFNLQDSSSTHVLVSRRDRYITLHNALWDVSASYPSTEPQTSPVDIHTPLASYKLINHLNEAVTAPLSLAYSTSGTHFFAGTQNSIAIFDLTNTDDPIHTIPTIPSKRNKLKGGGRGFKGYVSALSVSPPTSTSSEGLLAAGARTRYVGIYDCISGSEVTHFSLPGTVDGKKLRNENLAHIMGDGVSSLKWSPCGRYLYVAERQSDVLLIYDVRNFALALGYCAGRTALTKQKLGFDVWNAGASPYDVESIAHEVWAGGTDGKVRVWKDPYLKEGAVEADEVVDVGDGETMPVVGTLVHASGNLAVTARGILETGDDTLERGVRRGGSIRPRFSERGCLDILGLSGY